MEGHVFVVLLELSDNRADAGRLMERHDAWIARGFADGVFLLVGSLTPRRGGAILAHATSLAELEARVAEDPFVAQQVVDARIVEIAPWRADERLAFLVG